MPTATAGVPSRVTLSDEQRIKLLVMGKEAYQNKNFEDGIRIFTQVLHHEPDHAVSMVNRASCYLHLEKLQDALDDCDSALRLHPRYATGHLRRGQVLMKMGHLAEAKECFQISLELNKVRQQQIDTHGAEKVAATSSSTVQKPESGPTVVNIIPGAKTLQKVSQSVKESRASKKALKEISLQVERSQGLLSKKINSEWELESPDDPSHPFASHKLLHDDREDAYVPPDIPLPAPQALPSSACSTDKTQQHSDGLPLGRGWERAAALASLSVNDKKLHPGSPAFRKPQYASQFVTPAPSSGHSSESPDSPAYADSAPRAQQRPTYIHSPSTSSGAAGYDAPSIPTFKSPASPPSFAPTSYPSMGSGPALKAGWIGGLKAWIPAVPGRSSHDLRKGDFENNVPKPPIAQPKTRGAPFEVLVDSYARNMPNLDARITAVLKRGTVVYVTSVRSDGWATHDKGFTVCNDIYGQILWDRSRRLAAKKRDVCKQCRTRLHSGTSSSSASAMLWRPASALMARTLPPQVCRSCGEAFCGTCCHSKNLFKIPYCAPCKSAAVNRLSAVSMMDASNQTAQRALVPIVGGNSMAARMVEAGASAARRGYEAPGSEAQPAPWAASSMPSTSSASAMVPPAPRSSQRSLGASIPGQGPQVNWHTAASMFASQSPGDMTSSRPQVTRVHM